MPFLPPQVVGLVVGVGVLMLVMMMIGMRLAMHRDLERLSRRGRWSLVLMLAGVLAGAGLVYVLAVRVLAP
ncbi:MAG: hypothetical protein R3B06_07865 [Kofleriaceae bacterium]